jgi:hypothetical protein
MTGIVPLPVLSNQDNRRDDDRCDAPLSERNRADAYTGMLDSSVYQPLVFPVEVAMTVYVQVEWSCGRVVVAG